MNSERQILYAVQSGSFSPKKGFVMAGFWSVFPNDSEDHF